MEAMDILTFVNNYEKRRSNRMMKMMKAKTAVTQYERSVRPAPL
jgi:hypothetical protein